MTLADHRRSCEACTEYRAMGSRITTSSHIRIHGLLSRTTPSTIVVVLDRGSTVGELIYPRISLVETQWGFKPRG